MGELRPTGDFGDAISAALVGGVGHQHVDVAIGECGHDLLGVGSHHDAIDAGDLHRAVDNAGHQWGPAEELEGFSRESRRADAGGHDKQNRHDESYRKGCRVSKVVPRLNSGV